MPRKAKRKYSEDALIIDHSLYNSVREENVRKITH